MCIAEKVNFCKTGYSTFTKPVFIFYNPRKKMILADKIINLRKKCGWSQEELAEKMNVSRHGPVIIGLN